MKEVSALDFSKLFTNYDYKFSTENGNADFYENEKNRGMIVEINKTNHYFLTE